MLRALVLSDLVTTHLKTGIGCLSAYCGAISAGCGAGAGVMYLYGGRYNEISHTIVNALAINSGVVCDGAKASCAAKIASAVESGLLGMQMYMHGKEFYSGDGIVAGGVEATIKNVGQLAQSGMAETDRELIVFRDSFGSSLSPLLVEGYAKVTVVDIRYLNSSLVGNFVKFDDQDVLIIYSTMLLNSSLGLK